jgi:hypothetical protein
MCVDGAPSRGSPIRRPGDDELLLHAREAQPYAPVGAVHPERVRRQLVESPRERILVEPLDLPRLRPRLGVLGSDDDRTCTIGSEALEQPEAVRHAQAEPLSDRRSRRALGKEPLEERASLHAGIALLPEGQRDGQQNPAPVPLHRLGGVGEPESVGVLLVEVPGVCAGPAAARAAPRRPRPG